MSRWVGALVGVLVVAVAALGYVSYMLYEEGERRAEQVDELAAKVEAVDDVRQEVLGQVEAALGESASVLLSEANRLEGRLSAIEGDVADMQGFAWGPLGPTLTDLGDSVDSMQGRLTSVERCMDSISAVLRDLGSFIYC